MYGGTRAATVPGAEGLAAYTRSLARLAAEKASSGSMLDEDSEGAASTVVWRLWQVQKDRRSLRGSTAVHSQHLSSSDRVACRSADAKSSRA